MALNRHRGWTEAEIDEIVRLYTIEKRALVAIGRLFGVTDPSIRRVLKSRGVSPREARRQLTPDERSEIVRLYRDTEISIQALAKQYDVSRQAIRGIINVAGVPIERGWTNRIEFTSEQARDIVERYEKGEPPADIAASYGHSYFPIYRVLRERGIEIRSFGDASRAASTSEGFHCLPKGIYSGRRMRAIKNGCEWHITIQDVNAQFAKQKGLCFYTGIELKTTSCSGDYTRDVTNHPCALSIDRRDSSKDYTPDNIVLCCRFVNFAKNQWDEKTFRGLMSRAAENLIGESFVENRARAEDSVTA